MMLQAMQKLSRSAVSHRTTAQPSHPASTTAHVAAANDLACYKCVHAPQRATAIWHSLLLLLLLCQLLQAMQKVSRSEVCRRTTTQLSLLASTTALTAAGATAAAAAVSTTAGYAEGVKIRSLSPHLNPALPPCQHYGTCGGCSLQAMQYSAQLHHKALHIEQLLQRVGKFSAEVVQAARREPVAAEGGGQYGYRNKVQLAFSSRVWVEDDDVPCTSAAKNDQKGHGGQAAGLLLAESEGATQAAPAATTEGTAAGEAAAAAAAAAAGEDTAAGGAHLDAAAAAAGVARPGRVVGGWGLGFYLPGSNSVVMPVKECSLVVSHCHYQPQLGACGRPFSVVWLVVSPCSCCAATLPTKESRLTMIH
jgi:hypothetical protein